MILYFNSLRMVKLLNKRKVKNVAMLRFKLMKLSLKLIIRWKIILNKKKKMKVQMIYVNKS